MTLALFLVVLIGSILLGLPVAFALLLSSMALMVHMDMRRRRSVLSSRSGVAL